MGATVRGGIDPGDICLGLRVVGVGLLDLYIYGRIYDPDMGPFIMNPACGGTSIMSLSHTRNQPVGLGFLHLAIPYLPRRIPFSSGLLEL